MGFDGKGNSVFKVPEFMKEERADKSESTGTPCYTFDDFVQDRVRIDFRGFSGKELYHLRTLCEKINPGRDVPSYTFGKCYYVRQGRWCEGGPHQLAGQLCRATEVEV